jgi:hypothetical protein
VLKSPSDAACREDAVGGVFGPGVARGWPVGGPGVARGWPGGGPGVNEGKGPQPFAAGSQGTNR